MENKKTRWYYNDNIEPKDYMKSKKNYLKFITRCNIEDFHRIKSIKGFENFICDKRKDDKLDRDKIHEYKFYSLPYDNSSSKDMICYHSNIICNFEDEKYIKEKLISKFGDDVKFRKSNKNSITTNINQHNIKRGNWVENKSFSQSPNIKYPICILSFGRHNKFGYTHKLLSDLNIFHYLFIEKQEKQEYLEWYNDTYCKLVVCDNFSLQNQGGSIMRNYIIDYCKNILKKNRVWMLDDNIKRFMRYHNGVKNVIKSKCIFTSVEEYIQDIKNVGIVSHNLSSFITEGDKRSVIVKNTKCYSSLLIPTDNDIRFNDKYNEDVLISIRYIQKGYITLCFNHILYDKNTSGKDNGGNQVKLYKNKGYKDKYDYLYNKLKEMYDSNELSLINNKTVDDFCIEKELNGHSHHKIYYDYMKNHSNEIEWNDVMSYNKPPKTVEVLSLI